MSNKYIVKCSVVLPAAIYIGEEKAEQGFTLDFKKIKVAGESRKLPVSSKEGPVIQISNCWGEEETSPVYSTGSGINRNECKYQGMVCQLV